MIIATAWAMRAPVGAGGLARLRTLESTVGTAEDKGVHARWEFGQALLDLRHGAGRLPSGCPHEVVEGTRCSRCEIGFRVVFAAT